MYIIPSLIPSLTVASKVTPSKRMSTCPSSNITTYPISSRVDTERKLTLDSGTNITSSTSREPLDSSRNLMHPTPFTACMVCAPLFTWKYEPIYETLRNTDLIPVIWKDDPLSMNHAPLSSNSTNMLLLERETTRENSSLNFFENSFSSVDSKAAISASSSSSSFFLGH
jgi:hypothetical protein